MINNTSLYWIGLFLIASGFFSASETALFSLNKLQQKKLENSDSKSDQRISKILSKPRILLITILLGNTLVNISISSFAAMYALYLKEHYAILISDSAIITIQIALTTTIILILGEIIPKLIAWAKSYYIAKLVCIPLQILGYLLWPILKPLELFSKLLSKPSVENCSDVLTTDEFHTLIQSQNSIHPLEEHEKKILTGLFRLPKAEIREIIVPRVHITAIDVSKSIDELKAMIVESGYSRIPVYKDTIDEVVGVVYAKDILLKSAVSSISELMRQVWFVTENMKIQSLLNQFKSKKTQIAIVVDEYGGTSGLITLEDIMEELVGEIQDEYDNEEIPSFNRISDNVVIVNGMYSIRDLNNDLNINIDPNDFDNVADYLLEHFNHVPKINEKLTLEENLEFTILDSNKKRINRVRIERVNEQNNSDN